MKQVDGVYLPDGEEHLVGWMTNPKAREIVDGKGTYQIKKLRLALSHVKSFRTAVDVGGHCGLWSMQLVKSFEAVHAFEPVARHRECFAMNLDGETNWTLHPCALGERDGFVTLQSAPGSSGDTRITGEGDIPLRRLDDFGLTEVDFIKLDCEGYELFALRGGEETIREWKPTIIVEQKPGRGQQFGLPETGAVEWLKSLGYELKAVMSGDFVLTCD